MFSIGIAKVNKNVEGLEYWNLRTEYAGWKSFDIEEAKH